MKKSRVILLFLFWVLGFGTSLFGQTLKASLEVGNIPLKDGTLWIAWYDNETDFKKGAEGKMAYSQKISIKTQSQSRIVLDNIKAGEYAIRLFFDENGNGKIDTNFLGIPKEAYGFSNNVYPATRAATYEESKMKISTENQIIKIKMKQ